MVETHRLKIKSNRGESPWCVSDNRSLQGLVSLPLKLKHITALITTKTAKIKSSIASKKSYSLCMNHGIVA
jgi:hypothetical protein